MFWIIILASATTRLLYPPMPVREKAALPHILATLFEISEAVGIPAVTVATTARNPPLLTRGGIQEIETITIGLLLHLDTSSLIHIGPVP